MTHVFELYMGSISLKTWHFPSKRGVQGLLRRYPGLPCCYQTRLVQFESLTRQALRKLPSDVIEKLGGDQAARRVSQRSFASGSLAVPLSGIPSPKSQQSVTSLPGSLEDSPQRGRQNVAAQPKASRKV